MQKINELNCNTSDMEGNNGNELKRVCIIGNIKLDKHFNSSDTIADLKIYINSTTQIPINTILLKYKNNRKLLLKVNMMVLRHNLGPRRLCQGPTFV